MSGAVTRSPGFLERYYICRDTTGVMNRGFNISIRLSESLSDILLSNALRQVILASPYLTVNAFRESTNTPEKNKIDTTSGSTDECESKICISEDAKSDGQNYQLRSVKKILYSDVVTHTSVETLDSNFLETLSKIRIPVNREKTMWYLQRTTEKASGEEYLTFACNHVVFDGRSAIHFFEDLVHALADVSSKPFSDACTETIETLFDSLLDCPHELPEPSEIITDLYNTPLPLQFSSIASHFFIPKWISKYISSYYVPSSPNLYSHPPFKVAPFDGRNVSQFRLLKFGPEEVRLILKNCKEMKSSLTSVMASVMFKAIETNFTPVLGSFSQSCELMICGRRFYPEKQKSLRYGLFVSAFTSRILPGLTVRRATQLLSDGLLSATKDKATFYRAGLLRMLNIWDYLKAFTTDSEERNTFEISNLGRVNVSTEKWRITDAVFSQGVTFAHLTLSVISTPEGGMNIVISFHESLSEVSKDGILTIDDCIEEFRNGLLGQQGN